MKGAGKHPRHSELLSPLETTLSVSRSFVCSSWLCWEDAPWTPTTHSNYVSPFFFSCPLLSLCPSSPSSNLPTMCTPPSLSSAAPLFPPLSLSLSLTAPPTLCFAPFLIINPPFFPPLFPSTKSKIRLMKVAYYSSVQSPWQYIHVQRNMDMGLLRLQHKE